MNNVTTLSNLSVTRKFSLFWEVFVAKLSLTIYEKFQGCSLFSENGYK